MAAKPKLIRKTFEKWYPDELQSEFGLKLLASPPDTLRQWTAPNTPIPEKHRETIDELQLKLIRFRTVWNEAELIAKFVAPLLLFVDFEGEKFNSFSERTLTAEAGQYLLTGKVDWMTASGFRVPQAPYFFIHEYKRYLMSEADPIGQILAEMLAAQILNADGLPIYGCFIAGNIWTFILLEGKTYATSQGYDATDPDELAKIWSILQETKRRVALRAAGQS